MISIRKANHEDIADLKKLVDKLVPNNFNGFLNTSQIDYMIEKLYTQKALLDALDSGTDYFVATCYGVDCGVVSVLKHGPNLFLMHKIYVDEGYYGKGVGTALLHRIKEYVSSKVLPCTIELVINSHNPSREFYLKNGFVKVRDTELDLEEFIISEEVFSLELN